MLFRSGRLRASPDPQVRHDGAEGGLDDFDAGPDGLALRTPDVRAAPQVDPLDDHTLQTGEFFPQTCGTAPSGHARCVESQTAFERKLVFHDRGVLDRKPLVQFRQVQRSGHRQRDGVAIETCVFDGPDRGLRWSERPLPSSLMPGGVLVQMRLATICGSDRHTLKGLRTEPVPAILGHEGVGVVTAMGEPRKKTSEEPNEDRPLEIGDRVTWSIADSCGHCVFCTTYGLPEKCRTVFKYGHAALSNGSGLNGCYASHILLRPGTHICRPAESLPDAVVAPANCALATAINATRSFVQPPIPRTTTRHEPATSQIGRAHV